MVNLTVFVEGGPPESGNDFQTIDNSLVFREGFHRLFAQAVAGNEVDIKIAPLGSVTQAKLYLEKIERNKTNGVLLIDMDGPKEMRAERLKHYEPIDTKPLYFMVQEMEAWILAQPDKIESFATLNELSRKRQEERLEDSAILKAKHPEEIENPGEKLDTLFRQFYEEVRIRRGKEKRKGKRYKKSKDGPALIGLLDLRELESTFEDVNRLVQYFREMTNQ